MFTAAALGALMSLATFGAGCSKSGSSQEKSSQPVATNTRTSPTKTTQPPAGDLKDITLAVTGMT